MKLKFALIPIALLCGAIAARAFQPLYLSTSLTLTNASDYGNLIVALEEAQGGQDSQVAVGTSAGVILFNIPAR